MGVSKIHFKSIDSFRSDECTFVVGDSAILVNVISNSTCIDYLVLSELNVLSEAINTT